jgi:hypothetical protein
MRKIRLIGALCLCLLSFPAAGGFGLAQAMDGRELAQKVHDRYMGDNFSARAKMILIEEGGAKRIRDMTMMMLEENGVRKNLIRFTSPSDIAGTGFLSLENEDGSTDQFLYLPALDRTRRIVTSQRGRSFVNSDFTYEDMTRRPVDDSEHEIVREKQVSGWDCWILETRPLPEANSKYSLIRSVVPKSIHLSIKSEYFNKDGEHIKTYLVKQLEKIQSIWTPLEYIMLQHHDEHRTVMRIEEIEYNTNIGGKYFTTRYLENW